MNSRTIAIALVLSLGAAVAGCASSQPTPGPTQATGAAAAADLAGTLPTKVGGVTLERKALTAVQLSGIAGFEQLVQRLNNDFKQPEDLVAATASDPTGASDLRIVAVRLIGEDAGRLGAVMLAWTQSLQGASVEQTNLGKPCTKVTQPGQAPIYYYVKGDTIYMVQTADEALAKEALTALP